LPKNKKELPVLRPLLSVLSAIQFLGDVIETIPKVAGFRALSNLEPKERAYRVRNHLGTPNWKRRGRAYAIYNNVFLFSNVWKEGWRGDFEVAYRDPKTRAGWWWKTLKVGFLPKLLMFLASVGFFGKQLMDGLNAATEYDKTNYVVLPLGEDGTGETIYARVPMDETTRILSGIFWKTLNAARGEFGGWTDLLAYMGGQLPGAAPMFEVMANWYQFATGRNPRDEFRGRDILTDDEARAGGVDALIPMVRWTLNQTGQLNFDLRSRPAEESWLKRFVQVTPVINRWLRVTNYGEVEALRKGQREVQSEEARRRVRTSRGIVDALNKGYDVEQAKAFLGIPKEEERSFERRFKRAATRAVNDPLANTLLSATSNAQKVAVLRDYRTRNSLKRSEFKAVMEGLIDQGAISRAVRKEALVGVNGEAHQ
jgi:hypothetical protein